MSTRNRKSPQNWIQVYCILIFQQKRHCFKTEKVLVKYLNTPTILKNVEDFKSCSILGLKSPYTPGQQRTNHYSTFIIILIIMVILHFTDLCFMNWNIQLFFWSLSSVLIITEQIMLLILSLHWWLLRMLTIALNVPSDASKGVIYKIWIFFLHSFLISKNDVQHIFHIFQTQFLIQT